MALVIERVGSAAAAGGVQAGDTILAVNGHRVRDELEYRFYSGERPWPSKSGALASRGP